MTADAMAVELARARAQLRAAEDEIADLRKQLARRTVDVPLPEQRSSEPQDETVAVPRRAFEGLIKVAGHVSYGRSAAFLAPYPDATARFALGALHDAGLLDQDATDVDGITRMLREGIAEAHRGETADLGDFTQYLDREQT